MTNAELADKYALAGWIDITEVDDPEEWQQIIAALRQPSSELLKTITYAISLLEVEGNYNKCLQYLNAVEDKLAAAERDQ